MHHEDRRPLPRLRTGEQALFSLAVNLLPIDEARSALQGADDETAGLALKGKAKYMARRLREAAGQRGIELKLRR